ncbi:MAG: AAA-like domain-containing protein [Fimbriimonadaceae bacterium]
MSEPVQPGSGFFIAGGTLSADATSYVDREADHILFESLSAGKFCYVLNSRQMGKSSLCVRTIRRLQAAGVRTAFVDLTKIGGRNVTPDQWYAGILVEVGRSLNLRAEVLNYWNEQALLSPVQRLFGALRDVVLEAAGSAVTVFFDEIDATRSLPFSADEFFAAIRECFNRRVQDPAFNRLTFCLLGVAVPSDLINSPTSTPFNVGERIYLKDFTREEATSLAAGLNNRRSTTNNQQLLDRVFHWTNGHPYLTQSLCAAIAADSTIHSPHHVDELVKRDLFEPKARETNINLADVANRALHAGDLEDEPVKFRADLLSAYEVARKGKPLADDESNRVAALLKLSGIMRSDGHQLTVRNRIYEAVFDRAWVTENMPAQELRRQRKAFYVGVARTAVVSGSILAVVASLAFIAMRESKRAETAEAQARDLAYASTMTAMPTLLGQNNLTEMFRRIKALGSYSKSGWEWRYWNRIISLAQFTVPARGSNNVVLSPDGRLLANCGENRINVMSSSSGGLAKTIVAHSSQLLGVFWLPDSRQVLAASGDGEYELFDEVAAARLVAQTTGN